MPKVSVVIPVYNVEKYLKQCLDSVVNQTLQDIEIICVDDGSTDKSPSILDGYAMNDNRIKVIHKENSGYGHTMNVGMDCAKGQYIAIVESDDWIQSNMFETLYNAAFDNQLDFVKADFYEFMENEDKTLSLKYMRLSEIETHYNRILNPGNEMEVFRLLKYTWSGIYNTKFLRNNMIKHNETPGASYQDNGFWFQTFVCAKKVMFLNKPFYMYRQDNPNSSIHSKGKVYAVINEFDFIRKFLNSLGQEGNKYISVYTYFRLLNCLGNIERIDDSYKLEFLNRVKEEYLLAVEAKEIDKSMFHMYSISQLNEIAKDPEQYYFNILEDKKKTLDILNSYEKIIIYGAGIFGKSVFSKIKSLNLYNKVLCFAVTSLEEKRESILGVKFKCIDDLKKYASNTLVILSVKRDTKYYKEMSVNLERLGFEHIIDSESIL